MPAARATRRIELLLELTRPLERVRQPLLEQRDLGFEGRGALGCTGCDTLRLLHAPRRGRTVLSISTLLLGQIGANLCELNGLTRKQRHQQSVVLGNLDEHRREIGLCLARLLHEGACLVARRREKPLERARVALLLCERLLR